MKRCWNAEELAEHWTLTAEEQNLLHQRTEHNCLGFALLLKFFQIEGRFPQYRQEVPDAAIAHVSRQVGIAPDQVLRYDWQGRSIEYHRAQIREVLGFRTATVHDAQELIEWLTAREEAQDAPLDHLKALVYQHCRELRIEPPTQDRVERIVRSAVHTVHEKLCEALLVKMPAPALKEMDALLEQPDREQEAEAAREQEQRLPLHVLETDAGRASLDSILAEMVKYATALRLGTAEAEAILRRFTRNNVQHPTYQALVELGKAVKTLFLCDYLGSEPLRREIHEGLNVIENWNSANNFIFYGRGGEIATNRQDDQELAMLCLHLLQNCLIYINTLMIQRVLGEPDWNGRMTSTDLRALTPLFYTHVNPYGTFELDMETRLPLDEAA